MATLIANSCGYWRIEPASGEKQVCLLPRDHVGRGHSPTPDPSEEYDYEDEDDDGLDGPGVVGESVDRLPWSSTGSAEAGPAVGPAPAAAALRFDLATHGREENLVVADARTDFVEVPRDLVIAGGARAQHDVRPAPGLPPVPLESRPGPMPPLRDSADHRPAMPPTAAPPHSPGPRPVPAPVPASAHPPVPEHLAIALASRRAVDMLTWGEQPTDPEAAAAPADRTPLRQRVDLVLPPEQVRYTPSGPVRVELTVRVVPYQRCPTPAHRRSPPSASQKVVHCSGWIEQDGRWERLVLWVAYDAAGKLVAKVEDEQADDSGPTGDR